jgi:glucosyl-dolichyl phosphate glucuronosyltransferase
MVRMKRQVSVVVCTYTARRWEGLVAAISALQAQTLEPHEILVVVDHEPRLLERVASELSGTVALASAGSPGLAGSRNTGVHAATGSVVAFIDDDAVPEPEWLERLAGPYDDPDVAAVGGGIDPNWSVARPAWFPPEFDWVVGCTYRGLPEARATVRNLIGANMSFRREIFAHLEFFHGLGHANGRSLGGEETDFCIRLAKLLPDSQIVYEPSARVRHHVPPDRARFSYFMQRCYIEGVSKGVLARRVGSSTGLASERAYVRAIPAAALRAVAHAVRNRQPATALGAVAAAMGVGAAASGYAVSRLRRLSTVS